MRTNRARDLEPLTERLAGRLGYAYSPTAVHRVTQPTIHLDRNESGYSLVVQHPNDRRDEQPFGEERVSAGEMRRALTMALAATGGRTIRQVSA